MSNEEEKKLIKWKETIDNHEIPQDKLEQAIRQGFQQAKAKEKVRKHPIFKRSVWSIVVATILFMTLVTSIRVFPVMANAVASIPGMERFVEFIRDDKGLESALNNEYYQQLNLFAGKDDVTLTLDGVLADEQEMIVFYTIKSSNKDEVFNLGLPDITDKAGKDILMSGSATPGSGYDEKVAEQTGKVTIRFQDNVSEKEFIFNATAKSTERTIDFTIPFTLNKEKMPTTRYPVDETVLMEDQKIHIKQIEISPLKVAIHVDVDPSNSKEIFGFEDLRLVDENGDIWSSINNGITASGDENSEVMIYYLQSNYFEHSKELYLQFNKLMAMEKEEAFLMIDTEKEKIIQQPKDKRFSNLTVRGYFVELNLRADEDYHHSPFSDIIDANGQELSTRSGSFSRPLEDEILVGFDLPKEQLKNPIKLPLTGYPSYIEGNVEIKIK